ncbi:hypothetical protein C2845_PM05G18670 [Panicum miliaceum]|uniref:Ubiquitin-like protease family profile domain-containing protein n=1 Tax=Panicum miliaceum TaxID=4540 RepID=A0A3L6T3M7_PANMI|nr:hypothetical protein C2845_PM05G18670 [Panicum miliaceum]
MAAVDYRGRRKQRWRCEFWYWERVISYANHAVKYVPIKPPLMARKILKLLANDARTNIGLEMDKRLLHIEHKFDKKLIAQNEELAKLKNNKIMEDKVSGIEDDIAEMETDIKQMQQEQQELLQMVQHFLQSCTPSPEHVLRPMPAPTHVIQPSMPTSSHDHVSRQQLGLDVTLPFFKAKARLESEAEIAPNGEMGFNMQHQGGPSTQQLVDPSPHIARREPIIDHNYKLTEDDNVAAAFVELSYDNATVVEIEGHLIAAKQLRAIVSEGFMVGEIIDAYVDISNVKNASVSFISTLQAMMLLTDNLRNDKYMQFRKLINDKCVRRHLIFVPMNFKNNHWVLIVLNFKKTEVQILNSIAEMRDKEKEKALVQGIRYCLDSLGTPIDLCGWKTVSYLNIPQQEDGHSCGAFVIKYIVAWDGNKMAHNFTSEEAYFAKYLEEQHKDTKDEDDNGVEMVVNGIGNTSTPADSKIGGKGSKGTPSTTAASTEGGTGPTKGKEDG